MKTAAKVFIILGMISGFAAIIPLIVGSIALTKLDEAEDSADIIGIGILTFLFCSPIGGILMLCLSDDDFYDEEDEEDEEEA
jgi:hypothetical protein